MLKDMLVPMVLPAVLNLTVALAADAQIVRDQPVELMAIDVDEHLGDTVPLELIFTDETGRTAPLSMLLLTDKPNIIVLGYYQCPRTTPKR